MKFLVQRLLRKLELRYMIQARERQAALGHDVEISILPFHEVQVIHQFDSSQSKRDTPRFRYYLCCHFGGGMECNMELYMIRNSPYCRSGHPFPDPCSVRFKGQHYKYQFNIAQTIRSGINAFKYTPLHWHDFVQVWYTVRGRYGQRIFGKSIILEKGSLLIIPPYFAHEPFGIGNEVFELICCDFSAKFLKEFFNNKNSKNVFLKPNSTSIYLDERNMVQVEILLNEIVKKYKEDPLKCLILQKDKIAQLLNLIIYNAKEPIDTPHTVFIHTYKDAIQNAIDYIESHYIERLYLEDVCKQAYMSKSGFCNIFKQFTGNTFTEYVALARLIRASAIMHDTNKTNQEIAQEFGFHNRMNFYEQFKYYLGKSPKEYRMLR